MKQAQASIEYAPGSVSRAVYRNGAKRALDIALSLALAPIVVPMIAVLCLLILARDGHAPLFGHTRIGRDGRPFPCWKIRTMAPEAEARLAELLDEDPVAAEEWRERRKLADDPRITPFGEFLRRTSLDELPQIWNVLRGEMSLVGPRPVPEDELELYGAARSAYCALRPGITGLWQVSGRNEITYDERVALDVEYRRRLSFGLDLRLLLRTMGVMARPNGR